MDVFMEVIRQFHLCQGTSHGDSKRRQVASGDYNDIVQMLLEAPNFLPFSVRNTRGIDEWHSHMGFPVENLSIKHRVNPMDGMVLAWYPLASEIDPWHAPVLTKVGNPKRLS